MHSGTVDVNSYFIGLFVCLIKSCITEQTNGIAFVASGFELEPLGCKCGIRDRIDATVCHNVDVFLHDIFHLLSPLFLFIVIQIKSETQNIKNGLQHPRYRRPRSNRPPAGSSVCYHYLISSRFTLFMNQSCFRSNSSLLELDVSHNDISESAFRSMRLGSRRLAINIGELTTDFISASDKNYYGIFDDDDVPRILQALQYASSAVIFILTILCFQFLIQICVPCYPISTLTGRTQL